jgi:hypothetical protein
LLENQILSISYVPWEVCRYICVSHPVPIPQMFQTPALIVMSIGATRIHRSLTDYTNSEYYPSCLVCSVLMLTAADVEALRLSKSIQLGGDARRSQISNRSSQREFPSTWWRWSCTSHPRIIRLRGWAWVAWIASHRTSHSCWTLATTWRTVSREDELPPLVSKQYTLVLR